MTIVGDGVLDVPLITHRVWVFTAQLRVIHAQHVVFTAKRIAVNAQLTLAVAQGRDGPLLFAPPKSKQKGG